MVRLPEQEPVGEVAAVVAGTEAAVVAGKSEIGARTRAGSVVTTRRVVVTRRLVVTFLVVTLLATLAVRTNWPCDPCAYASSALSELPFCGPTALVGVVNTPPLTAKKTKTAHAVNRWTCRRFEVGSLRSNC